MHGVYSRRGDAGLGGEENGAIDGSGRLECVEGWVRSLVKDRRWIGDGQREMDGWMVDGLVKEKKASRVGWSAERINNE